MSRGFVLGSLTGVLLPIALVLAAPGLIGLPRELAAPSALVLMTIGLWATGLVADHITSLLFFAFATIFAVAPTPVIFHGFSTGAFWLVFGGLIAGVAINKTGLGRRLALYFHHRLEGSYARLIGGIVVLSAALGFLVPSAVGRVVILVPVVQALADDLGFVEGRRGRYGMTLAAAFGTIMPSFGILPANLPNLVLLGAAESLYGISPGFLFYLVINYPVLGVLKIAMIIPLLLLLFPDEPGRRDDGVSSGPITPEERRLLVILVGALLLWATDVWHGVAPAWVALAAGVLCILPVTGMVGPRSFNTEVNFASLFHIAGLLGMVNLIAASGLGDWLGEVLLAKLPLLHGADAWNYGAIVLFSALMGLLTAASGVSAVLTPLAGPIASASGMPLLAVLMTQIVVFSCAILPYQVGPIAIALAIGRVPVGVALRLSLPLSALTLVFLAPLQFLWWRVIGLLPGAA